MKAIRCGGSAARTVARPASARASARRRRGRATHSAAAGHSTTTPPASSASRARSAHNIGPKLVAIVIRTGTVQYGLNVRSFPQIDQIKRNFHVFFFISLIL